MATITAKDGTQIYYKDWGKGQPIVFSHGWPLTADDWDGQMLYFGQLGYRVIAHDRRGHGRSGQTWEGNEMDTYADDLAGLFEHLDLKDAIMVGHSTGGGEVARYLGRHGSKRVSKAALISACLLYTSRSVNSLVTSSPVCDSCSTRPSCFNSEIADSSCADGILRVADKVRAASCGEFEVRLAMYPLWLSLIHI